MAEAVPAEALLERLVSAIRTAVGPEAILEASVGPHLGPAPLLVVPPERLRAVLAFLRDEPAFRFDFLNTLHGIDRPPDRMEVFYYLQSMESGHAVALKVVVPREDPRLPSVADLYPAADWQEREAYDHFGLHFEGHPNLRRILLPDDWVGHPLRKDYAPHDEGV
ncbi:NADH-quinone oxidoreductase subunit C [Hydrogenibacillus schlegelii]|uniref:NADH-quinone oxidoreductase subunit C n=1 Tax=Hydrogenibacillus schlegelii TaxID=1484 RepID=A0A179IPN4_HYDSH|nr:NADH-quinone oxidoreductase subunit C [Hydrogenibacillus schlegelii]OAR04213.1 hypothetical protein SA87_07125 [Hydrogenibacillus schlegelii]PTQ54570.1 MAG: NADH-ubiquinone oxidoreductase chain C [Hydrogenibacillus schlegelii]